MSPSPNPSPDPAALLREALSGTEAPVLWQPPTLAELAPLFPELVLHELVGQGGMAAVFRATQSKLERPVALKVMRRDLAGQPQFAERFVREARALAALSNPHVLTIHDFGERGGHCYLVTEFVDGANLRELMRLGRLSPSEVLRIVPQICAGLYFAHTHGVVHRDIKPENVLVDRDGQVKLADFGLAKLVGEPAAATFTRPSQVFGTPHYMAPEQWHGSGAVDHRADIYSLGVVLYELLTGRLPVGTYAPASAQPGVPPGIDQVVQRSLQQEPEQRYQSAREVQHDLEAQQQPAAANTARAAAPVAAATAGDPVATRLLAFATGLLVFGATALFVFHQHEVRLSGSQEYLSARANVATATLQAIQETVARGEPWRGQLPDLPPNTVTFNLESGLVQLITLGGLGTLAVLLMVLASAAWRRARHDSSSRLQHVFALVLFGLPPFAGSCAGLTWLADRSRQTWPVVASILLLAAVGCGLLMWAWRAGAVRLPGRPAPIGRATWLTLLVGLVAGASLVAGAWFGPRPDDRKLTWQRPLTGSELAGMSRLQVLEHLGPPRSVTCAPNTMIWGYRGLDGQDRNDAVQFTNGIVTMSQHPAVLLVPEPKPANGAFAGQTVEELVKALGPASDTAAGATGTTLSWPDGSYASISPDGFVVHVGK